MDALLRDLQVASGPTSWATVGINIGVAFLLGLFIVMVYRATHRQMLVSFTFINTLVVICMIMSMVIQVIGDNVARAFGLAGAMSMVRFRTVVKDTRDIAFLFFAIGAGMAAGTGNLKLALIGTPVIGLLVAVLHWTGHGTTADEVHLLSLETDVGHEAGREAYLDVFRRRLAQWSLMNTRSVRAGTGIHYVFQVRLRRDTRSQDVIHDLGGVEGVVRAQLSLGEEPEA